MESNILQGSSYDSLHIQWIIFKKQFLLLESIISGNIIFRQASFATGTDSQHAYHSRYVLNRIHQQRMRKEKQMKYSKLRFFNRHEVYLPGLWISVHLNTSHKQHEGCARRQSCQQHDWNQNNIQLIISRAKSLKHQVKYVVEQQLVCLWRRLQMQV